MRIAKIAQVFFISILLVLLSFCHQAWPQVSLESLQFLTGPGTPKSQISAIAPDQGIISTVAGTGTAGFSGDGGDAIQAQLSYPAAVALDSSGNLFIVEQGNHRIRKVDTSGLITTVAGTGSPGFSGDGGPAPQAQLNSPRDIAVDTAGDLYIAEFRNNRVRKVDTQGIITTLAGTGRAGFGGDGGPAAQAMLDRPASLALDNAGNLYIADYGNNRARKVDTRGVITTVAGTGSPGFSGDGGPAAQAQLSRPIGVSLDNAGNLYIVDNGNNVVRRVGAQGIITTIAGTGTEGFSGDGGPATQAQLRGPGDIAADSAGNLYIADSVNNRVRMVDSTGIINTIAGTGIEGFSGDGGAAIEAQLNQPFAVLVDGDGNLYIADTLNHRVRKVIFGPPIVSASATPSGGTSPLTVNFTGRGNDPDGGAVVYFWDFGDGSPQSTQQNPSHTYQNLGTYTATLIVTDDEGQQTRDSLTINVLPPPIVLVEIELSPPSVSLARPGETVQLHAEGLYSNGDRADITSLVTWSSSDPGVASVNASGVVGAVSNGSATITATSGSISGPTAVTVDIPRLISISLEPSPVSIAGIGQRAQLTVTGVYSNGAEADISRQAIYQIEDPSIASISTVGRVTALGQGMTNIWARVGELSELAVLIVGEGGPAGPSGPSMPVTGIVRARPQLLAAGFDPSIVDVQDDSFFIIALVRPGLVPINSVTITQNQGQFSFGMAHRHTLSNGDQIWRAILNFPRGSIGNQNLRAIWGDQPGEFNITVTDQVAALHSFPNLEFCNCPEPDTSATISSPPMEDEVRPIHRIRPQVLAAGFDPTLINIANDSFDIVAIARQGALPIDTVTLTQNRGTFRFAMQRSETLPNGDAIYRATFNFPRGSIRFQTLRALWGDQPGEFNITVIDAAQQRHSFPDLEFGNNPAIDLMGR